MSTAALPPGHAEFLRGFEHHRAGRIAQAQAHYEAAVAANPGHVDALHLLGTIKAQTGSPVEGERLIAAALRLQPDAAQILSNYGNVLNLLDRKAEALASYDRALALVPGQADAMFNRANVLFALGRLEEALAGYESAARLAPGNPVVATGRGNALMALKRHAEALAAYDQVLAAAPGHLDAILNRSSVLKELDRAEEAIAVYDRVLAALPANATARLGRAHALVMLGRATEGLAAIEPVLALEPDNAEAWYTHGHALLALVRLEDALASFTRAAALKPDFIEAVYNRADALRGLGRYPEAMPEFERVLAKDPDHTHALAGLATAAMQCCDWHTRSRLTSVLEAKVRAGGGRGLMPFSFVSLSGSKELQLACARNFTAQTCPQPPVRLWQGRPQRRERIHLAYLSSDYRRHAMGYQMAELFEVHDRARFKVTGISAGPNDHSPVRRRIETAFDEFHDVAAWRSKETAELIHRLGVDIAVDLNGHTIYSRMGALAWRPAPVQATYLGFPGTSGASFIDYVIADRIVAPAQDQPFFSEAIVHLPDCYQVSDRQRKIGPKPTRAACGLPEAAFVFACFNSSYKIAPEIFGVWMRILKAKPDGVLWLVRGNDTMRANLWHAAEAHGVARERLVFCEAVDPEAHLARHACADLYLDTLPYNSHGTGSFALWGGLPMLTCLGPTFAGRVCASLLHAIGLPELVAGSLEEYEAMALALANDPSCLAAVRKRLADNRETAPLFDTDRFRRQIERAYETMWEIALVGEAPRPFAVDG